MTKRVVARFETHCGKRPAQRISRADVVKFKDALLADGQTPVNTNKILVSLGALLNLGVKNTLLETNAATGIRIAVRARAKDARQPFDVPALNAIFSSTVYTNGERPEGGAGEAAYWLPLLAMFTGCRIEEMPSYDRRISIAKPSRAGRSAGRGVGTAGRETP